MNLISKIKSYFIHQGFAQWKGIARHENALEFKQPEQEILLDLGRYIKKNLPESETIENRRHRLPKHTAIACLSLDELLPLLQSILNIDYEQTKLQGQEFNWDFNYIVKFHERCNNTICIHNALSLRENNPRSCYYRLATVRKYDNVYYCWNHSENSDGSVKQLA